MSNIMDLLGQIEKLAYSLAIWVILIPKTVIKIFLDPGWVRGYVAKEFAEYAEAEKAGIQSVPALVTPTGNVLHINFGASMEEVKG